MAWRSISTPVLAAALLGAIIALALASKPAPRRQTKAEKRHAKRLGRKQGRASTSNRAKSKRKETRQRLVKEIGIDEFRKIVQNDRREKEEQRERMEAAVDDPDSLQLVIDLNWAESASGKELSSLAKQLCYVYNRARASSTPPRLTLTSYQGRASEILKSAGAESWVVDRNPLGVFDLFDPADVVYLSPDAEEPLDEVVATNVYIIGGIVDRNLHKGLTLGVAEGVQARAMRLPFDEHLPEVPRKYRVLTVCACVGVLMAVHAGEGWREALEKSVPKRGVGTALKRARGGAYRGATPVEGGAAGLIGEGSEWAGVVPRSKVEVVAPGSDITNAGVDTGHVDGGGGSSGSGGSVVRSEENSSEASPANDCLDSSLPVATCLDPEVV